MRQVFFVMIAFQEGKARRVDIRLVAGDRFFNLLSVGASEDGIGEKLMSTPALVPRGEDKIFLRVFAQQLRESFESCLLQDSDFSRNKFHLFWCPSLETLLLELFLFRGWAMGRFIPAFWQKSSG